jgi:hypothetical protein
LRGALKWVKNGKLYLRASKPAATSPPVDGACPVEARGKMKRHTMKRADTANSKTEKPGRSSRLRQKSEQKRHKTSSADPKGDQTLRDEINQLYTDLQKRSLDVLKAWQRRPRIHLGALNKPEQRTELVKKLGEQRLSLLIERAATYQKTPSLENYLRLRRDIPEVEIDVAMFGGLDVLFSIEPDLKKHGIDPDLVADAFEAYEPAIDLLTLQLMECLVARNNLPKSGPRHIDKRKEAIDDPLIDFLIVTMLEAMEWNKEYTSLEIPSSLIVLIRDRLCGPNPGLRKGHLSKQTKLNAAFLAAQYFKPAGGETISVRKLADIAGVGRSTAERWLKDQSFQQSLENFRKVVESAEFQQRRGAYLKNVQSKKVAET